MNAEELYKVLRIQILDGKRKAGENLGEIPLATQYGVSRLYVKSALQKLQGEQLVKHIRNRGYFVREISNSLLEEINDIRQALEGVIVKRVIRVASDQELRELSKTMDRVAVFIKNAMIEDGLEEIGKFYQLLYQIARYDRVVSILETYSDYITIIRRNSAKTQEEHMESLACAQALLKAILARNEADALRCIEERGQAFLVPGITPLKQSD